MVVREELRVESRLVVTSGQVRLYPVMAPFWSIGGGGIHCSVALVEKKVELLQFMGGAAGTSESEKVINSNTSTASTVPGCSESQMYT